MTYCAFSILSIMVISYCLSNSGLLCISWSLYKLACVQSDSTPDQTIQPRLISRVGKPIMGSFFFQRNICMLERLWLKWWAKDHEKILKLKAPILIALLILWTVEKHWICLSCVYTDKRCSGFHDHTSIKYIKKIWIKGCQQKLLLINMRKFWKVDFYIVNDLYLISWLFLSHLFLNEVALWSLVRYIGIISYMEKHRVKT